MAASMVALSVPAGAQPDPEVIDLAAPPAAPAAPAAAPAAEPPPPLAPTETRPEEPGQETPVATQPPIIGDEPREVPDYDGRGDEPITAGDVFIWIPRAIFFPAYLVSEYVVRWPLGKLTTAVDEYEVQELLTEFFTFGPEGKSGIVPSGLIDFGLRPSIGVYFFSDDVITDGNGIRAHLAFGGEDWYRGTLSMRQVLNEESPTQNEQFIQLKGTYSHRPDWKFYGTGPDAADNHETRYTAQFIGARFHFDGGFWRSSRLVTHIGVTDAQFKDIGCCDDLLLSQGITAGFFPEPTLYRDGYLLAFAGGHLSIDTRRERNKFTGDASDHVSPTGSGVKINLRGEVNGGLRESLLDIADPTSLQRPSFVKYGATLGGFLDVYNQRVVGLSVFADFVDPTAKDAPVPFTELVSFGGARPLRGFLENRLLDRSGIAARLEYRWPIWVALDGTAQYDIGNVFGEHLENFDVKKLRQSFGFGFRANGSRDHAFELLLAFGTDTIENDAKPENFRFVFGTTAGF